MYQRPAQPNEDDRERHRSRPHHSAPSPVGHWTRTVGALVPLVIGELVKEPEKRWRFIRIASVALAVINEGAYAYRVQQQRRDEQHER